jgi:hypothetical protein
VTGVTFWRFSANRGPRRRDPVANSYDRLPGLGDPASMHCGPQTRMGAIVAERKKGSVCKPYHYGPWEYGYRYYR